ncbi:MAG: hypothetical protein HKN56_01440 [Gammaproteobacteria bacterium]|nr:hypothetical protein [Gammaproteobacteria bacterium]
MPLWQGQDMNDYDDDDFFDDDFIPDEDDVEMTVPKRRATRNCWRKIERARDRIALRRELGDFDFRID